MHQCEKCMLSSRRLSAFSAEVPMHVITVGLTLLTAYLLHQDLPQCD